MGILDPLRYYYQFAERVTQAIYNVTNKIAWPSLIVFLIMLVVVFTGTYPQSAEREVYILGIVAAVLFGISATIQLLAVYAQNFARFFLRILGRTN